MRTIRDVMSVDIEVLRTTETAADAACFLATHGDEAVPLCLSDDSLAEFAEADGVVALDIDVALDDAVVVMCRHHRARLPVTERARVVGVVTRRDVARSISFQSPWADS